MNERLVEVVTERARLFGLDAAALLQRDRKGGLREPGYVSANGTCRLIEASDGWVALSLARADDFDVIPALTYSQGDSWEAIYRVAGVDTAQAFRDRAIELQLPAALVAEATAQTLPKIIEKHIPRKVIDLSALWAGPLTAGLLAQAGAEVIRIASTGRPDPTALNSPDHDARLNGRKREVQLDLSQPGGRDQLRELLVDADVLVTSARAPALARLGLDPETLPHVTWIAITGHGFTSEGAHRVGFGDDCAAAGGLVKWNDDAPKFIGDALADPLTGLEGALAVCSGQRGLIDMNMSRVAAAYAEMIA